MIYPLSIHYSTKKMLKNFNVKTFGDPCGISFFFYDKRSWMNSTKFIEWVRLYQELIFIRLGISKKKLNASRKHIFPVQFAKNIWLFIRKLSIFLHNKVNGSHSGHTQSANVTNNGNNKKKKLSQKFFTKQTYIEFSKCLYIRLNTLIITKLFTITIWVRITKTKIISV